ncbi:MAG: hypothetical protein RLY58_1465 [Pseudomonadota bacterium]|jgi:hypothetical protein
MSSVIKLNGEWVACRLFYPAPFYLNRSTHHVGGTAEPVMDAFYEYDTKLILPYFIHMSDGLFEVVYQQQAYRFLAQDTFYRADRSIYGTLFAV